MTPDEGQGRAEARVHTLKTWPEYFAAVKRGEKTFEIRHNDRDFAVGDVLVLQEWNPDTQQYTSEMVSVRVTYLTAWGQTDSQVVMAIQLHTITAALRAERIKALEEAAKIAGSPDNLRFVGGSTGNAWDTQKAIVAAIREQLRENVTVHAESVDQLHENVTRSRSDVTQARRAGEQ